MTTFETKPTPRTHTATTPTPPPPPTAADRTPGAPLQDVRSNGDHAINRPLTSLIKELRDEAMDLVQNEIRLAKAELNEKTTEIKRAAISIASGGAVLFAGVVVLLLALSAGLYAAMVAMDINPMLAGWLAPLIIGGLTVAVGYGMVKKGQDDLEPRNLRPERTERSLRETKNWAERKV
ncbi:MAG: phage holin family protein [Phycisphaerales bacterium]